MLVDLVLQIFYTHTDVLSICSISYKEKPVGISNYNHVLSILPCISVSFCFMCIQSLLLCAYIFRIAVSSQRMKLFIIVKCLSLFLIIFLTLKYILYDINIATQSFFELFLDCVQFTTYFLLIYLCFYNKVSLLQTTYNCVLILDPREEKIYLFLYNIRNSYFKVKVSEVKSVCFPR